MFGVVLNSLLMRTIPHTAKARGSRRHDRRKKIVLLVGLAFGSLPLVFGS
jgi:hypothetical protein